METWGTWEYIFLLISNMWESRIIVPRRGSHFLEMIEFDTGGNLIFLEMSNFAYAKPENPYGNPVFPSGLREMPNASLLFMPYESWSSDH